MDKINSEEAAIEGEDFDFLFVSFIAEVHRRVNSS